MSWTPSEMCGGGADCVADFCEVYCRIAGSLSEFMPPPLPWKAFCSYLCVPVSVCRHMSLWSRCTVCSPLPAAMLDESGVGGGWDWNASSLQWICALWLVFMGARSPGGLLSWRWQMYRAMHITAYVCVWERWYIYIYMYESVFVCESGKPCVLFWEEIFSLMELDLPVDENVHLNVSSHISRPPVKYGDSVESFRCHPLFYVFTLVMNGTSLCVPSRLRGKVWVNTRVGRSQTWKLLIGAVCDF